MKARTKISKIRFIWAVVYRLFIGLAAVFCAFTLSYWMTTPLFTRNGYYPGSYLNQMITAGIALVLLIIGGVVVGFIMGPRQRAVWQSLIEAVSRISKGNFDVHVDVQMIREPGGDEHPFRKLVHGINDMAQELAQLERMRQEFISNVSHEIQSPLTSITGFATALQSDELSREQRQRYLQIIETESKRLSRLSDNLLKLTSLESGHHPFHMETYRLDRQIRDVVLASEPLWLEKQIQVDIAVPNILLTADKDLLSQVWINVFSNALKFTPSEGTAMITADTSDGWVTVRIADTGIGLTEEDKRRIFERFYKADKSRSGRTSGAGLGLSIVKKILDLHGGEILVESCYGSGSTFIVSLPLKQSTD